MSNSGSMLERLYVQEGSMGEVSLRYTIWLALCAERPAKTNCYSSSVRCDDTMLWIGMHPALGCCSLCLCFLLNRFLTHEKCAPRTSLSLIIYIYFINHVIRLFYPCTDFPDRDHVVLLLTYTISIMQEFNQNINSPGLRVGGSTAAARPAN